MNTVFALIDCNNFFVSCERLFRPDLARRPVVVLSSNDGCVVARSNETKQLGVPMGAPAFKYRQLFRAQGVVQFSGNFELYGDISDRLTRLLAGITPRLEIYSVDESFLDISSLAVPDYAAWAREVRRRIEREIGVPVSIGIAPTKTLAKLASDQAKKDSALDGVLDLSSLLAADRAVYLSRLPLHHIWGVGRRLAPRLRAEGLHTALDIASLRPRRAQQLMGIHGRQLVAELSGTSCHPLEPLSKIRHSVMHGRMFGEDTNQVGVIEAAIASLTAKAAWRLRREQLLARTAVLYLSTNRHLPGYLRRRQQAHFSTPTADTGLITSQLVSSLPTLVQPGQRYHRAVVLLYDLVSAQQFQLDLLGTINSAKHNRSQARLQAMDDLTRRYGRNAAHYAAEDLSAAWQPKHRLRSPRYTTAWSDLPAAIPKGLQC